MYIFPPYVTKNCFKKSEKILRYFIYTEVFATLYNQFLSAFESFFEWKKKVKFFLWRREN